MNSMTIKQLHSLIKQAYDVIGNSLVIGESLVLLSIMQTQTCLLLESEMTLRNCFPLCTVKDPHARAVRAALISPIIENDGNNDMNKYSFTRGF